MTTLYREKKNIKNLKTFRKMRNGDDKETSHIETNRMRKQREKQTQKKKER